MLPRVLDLYCSAGGVGLALDRLGISHVGVDIEDKSDKYTGDFIQTDASDIGALERALTERYSEVPDFDLVWASPPCQAYSVLSYVHYDNPKDHHPTIDELDVRGVIEAFTPGDYIIENVANCEDLVSPTRINGHGVGLPFGLERWFETSYPCPNQMGTGEAEAGIFTKGSGDWRSKKLLARAKDVPEDWTEQEIRSAMPLPFVQHLLHYCPSTQNIPPVADTKQTLLPTTSD